MGRLPWLASILLCKRPWYFNQSVNYDKSAKWYNESPYLWPKTASLFSKSTCASFLRNFWTRHYSIHIDSFTAGNTTHVDVNIALWRHIQRCLSKTIQRERKEIAFKCALMYLFIIFLFKHNLITIVFFLLNWISNLDMTLLQTIQYFKSRRRSR